MENRKTQTITRQSGLDQLESDASELDLKRLNSILDINDQIANDKASFLSQKARFESELIRIPLDSEAVYKYFGLMLGTFPPAAIFARILLDSDSFRSEDSWLLALLFFVNLVAAFTGFFSGKLIARMVRYAESTSWLNMMLLLPLIGIVWGLMAGGAGGAIFFIFGAFFGAFIGALVGCVALPMFTVFHRLLKKGDQIERSQFLPLAFGTAFTICAFILGF
jgi:hypothetical protein